MAIEHSGPVLVGGAKGQPIQAIEHCTQRRDAWTLKNQTIS